MKLRHLLFSITPEKNVAQELSMTLLRVYLGLALAFGHGIKKLPPADQFVSGVEAMGFPLPVVFAWSAGLAEFIGGLLLAAGLLTRPAAFFIACTMATAGFLRHAQDPFSVKELAFAYLLIALVFLCRGAGRWSVDRFISR